MFRFLRIFFLTFFILVVSSAPLLALPFTDGVAPEIDPSIAPSAITLLTGGVLILKSKFKRK